MRDGRSDSQQAFSSIYFYLSTSSTMSFFSLCHLSLQCSQALFRITHKARRSMSFCQSLSTRVADIPHASAEGIAVCLYQSFI